jgi:UDP-N-acetylmuramate--alanine ligase
MIGGRFLCSGRYRIGNGDTIVMESCEYYNSFHSFSPTVPSF